MLINNITINKAMEKYSKKMRRINGQINHFDIMAIVMVWDYQKKKSEHKRKDAESSLLKSVHVYSRRSHLPFTKSRRQLGEEAHAAWMRRFARYSARGRILQSSIVAGPGLTCSNINTQLTFKHKSNHSTIEYSINLKKYGNAIYKLNIPSIFFTLFPFY